MGKYIKKRETFYLSGYDPRGTRYYYNLYKKEAAKQSKVNHMDISVGKRERPQQYIQTWKIESHSNEMKTTTQYHFLEWDDIIRHDWKKNFIELVLDLWFYFKIYILSGRFGQYMMISPYQMVGIFLPSVYTFFSLLFSVFVGYETFLYVGEVWGIVAGTLLCYTLLYILMTIAQKIAVFWLVRIFVFAARYALMEHKILDARLEIFSRYIEKQIKASIHNNVDEILFVAHSVGTILMIPLLENILKNLDKNTEVQLSVLMLGECIPLVSGIDKATDYKDKMAYVAQSSNIIWVDYTTVIDGACFPQLNYFDDVGIQIAEKEHFHFLSARFHTLFSKIRYKKLRKNKYLTHFIYFMATEFQGEYDYFKMTAGHYPLSDIQCSKGGL